MITQIKIVNTFTDWDGVSVDIIEGNINGSTQTRYCWTKGDMQYLLNRKGDRISGNLEQLIYGLLSENNDNQWLKAYISLYNQRSKEQEEIELDRAAELARADLGWGW